MASSPPAARAGIKRPRPSISSASYKEVEIAVHDVSWASLPGYLIKAKVVGDDGPVYLTVTDLVRVWWNCTTKEQVEEDLLANNPPP